LIADLPLPEIAAKDLGTAHAAEKFLCRVGASAEIPFREVARLTPR
jgi:hypothetical protein